MTASQVLLVTGGNGFLGQHIVNQLRSQPTVKEVRVLDIQPYSNNLGNLDCKSLETPLVSFTADLADVEGSRPAFRGATAVIHCAALVDRTFPPDEQKLRRNNVTATEAVVRLCQEESVPVLVATSTAEVVYRPYIRAGSFCILINQTEARSEPPRDPVEAAKPLTAYVASKLEAERLVLAANATPLLLPHDAHQGRLHTVVLRPPLMYGEGDTGVVPPLAKLASMTDGVLLQIGGTTNRHTHAYVGNVAWAHICAWRTLVEEKSNGRIESRQTVSGLAVFVTDDTPKGDLLRLAQTLLTLDSCKASPPSPSRPPASLVKLVATPVPATVWFVGAWLVELAARLLRMRLPVEPRATVRYLSSVVMLSRLRAETRLNYTPCYSSSEALSRSKSYYASQLLPTLKAHHQD